MRKLRQTVGQMGRIVEKLIANKSEDLVFPNQRYLRANGSNHHRQGGR